MNSEEFINRVKKLVRDQTVEDTINQVKKPSGRGISQLKRNRMEWYNNLEEIDVDHITYMIKDGADYAIFGFLGILDGNKIIDGECGEEKGVFELFFIKNGKKTWLNNPEKIGLHELYNAEE